MASDELRTVLSPLDELRTVLSPLVGSEYPAVYLTDDSYVRFNEELEDEDSCSTVDDLYEKQFVLRLAETDDREDEGHSFSIHASTVEEAILCLDYLVGLKDTRYQQMELDYKDDGDTRLCPFGVTILEKILQNSARRIIFNNMIFTPDHCRTLATSGTKTYVEFSDCEFQDEGAAFVEASAARQDETLGPAKLRFEGSNPFNDRNWALFLSQHKLDSLVLHEMNLNSEASCRALATAEVRCLTLEECDLEEDEGAALAQALIESVRQGRGPNGLCFNRNPFDSSERFVTFTNALRGNTNLERLELSYSELSYMNYRQDTQALAAALHENKGLVHLTVYFRESDDNGRTELLEAIAMHPSLRSLDFVCYCYSKEKRIFTKAVADMLSVNDRVEEMRFRRDTFDKDYWGAYVVPRLECNTYRKRFPSIQKIEEASTRAAVLARALAKFGNKPHLVWMLLNQSHDIVSSYIDAAHGRNSIPLRKRSRSPPLDARNAASD
jgi:hypothetical protein